MRGGVPHTLYNIGAASQPCASECFGLYQRVCVPPCRASVKVLVRDVAAARLVHTGRVRVCSGRP